MILFRRTLIVVLILMVISCRETVTLTDITQATVITEVDTTKDDQGTDSTNNQKIWIVDRTGKKWDITHAVDRYEFVPENFQFGLGPYAIEPVNDPKMLTPEDDGYPDSGDDQLVIGVKLNGHVRAYPLRYLVDYEVVNERFEDALVAVTY